MVSSVSRDASFTFRGRRIAYREYGAGPRVVMLIHGLLMDSRMYTTLAPTIAAGGHRVIAVDMLGHGASDQPHEMTAYSMPQFGRDVIALLDHLDLREAVIGGTSLGANIALEVAVAAPARVRSCSRCRCSRMPCPQPPPPSSRSPSRFASAIA